MRSVRFVCHVCLSVCVQNYCKINQPISLKLSVTIRAHSPSDSLRQSTSLPTKHISRAGCYSENMKTLALTPTPDHNRSTSINLYTLAMDRFRSADDAGEGGCPTPCKKGGEIVPAEYVQGKMSGLRIPQRQTDRALIEQRYKYGWLAVWLSGNALASINVVAIRQTRLVPGWVTVCGRVNHLGM